MPPDRAPYGRNGFQLLRGEHARPVADNGVKRSGPIRRRFWRWLRMSPGGRPIRGSMERNRLAVGRDSARRPVLHAQRPGAESAMVIAPESPSGTAHPLDPLSAAEIADAVA